MHCKIILYARIRTAAGISFSYFEKLTVPSLFVCDALLLLRVAPPLKTGTRLQKVDNIEVKMIES